MPYQNRIRVSGEKVGKLKFIEMFSTVTLFWRLSHLAMRRQRRGRG